MATTKHSITTQKLADRRLVGRTIVSVDLRTYEDENGQVMFDPILCLDDGSVFYLTVQEDYRGADYGIALHKTPARRSPAHPKKKSMTPNKS